MGGDTASVTYIQWSRQLQALLDSRDRRAQSRSAGRLFGVQGTDMLKSDRGPLRMTAPGSAEGERLDRVLAQHFPEISRTRFQALIGEGAVTVGGAVVREPRHSIRGGDIIEALVPEPAAAAPEAEAIPLAVVHEDSDLIVIDKPAGLVVHPAAGNWTGTLVNALLAHCGDTLSSIGGVRRPGIVHRLDKDTTGLMVVAKNDHAHRALQRQFAAHGRDGKLERTYLALVWGRPDRQSGEIRAEIGRKRTSRTKMTVVQEGGGRTAATHYRVIESFAFARGPAASLVELQLETGRTHQIRVHLAHIGHPLLGDDTYGAGFRTFATKLPQSARAALKALNRHALHAATLGFEHPTSKAAMRFHSPLPADMAALLEALRDSPPAT
jgi:23S rRNA pseudouridine1911/1915/1917 synthase